MALKKRVVLSFIPTDKNLMILQNMGFLNKRGKSTGRLNLNEFINRCLDDKIGIDDASQNEMLLEKLLLAEIKTEQKKRDDFCKESEVKLRELARRLEYRRQQTKVRDYDEINASEN